MVEFKPSDVNLLSGFPPLVATFNKTEAECMAAMILRTLVVNGNTWRPLAWKEIAEVVNADISNHENNPAALLMYDIARNPFSKPNPYDLVDRGFAKWADKPGGQLEFTEAGLERLRRWVRK